MECLGCNYIETAPNRHRQKGIYESQIDTKLRRASSKNQGA
jgi:hypothetical protein